MITVEGKKIYVPHTGVTLRSIVNAAKSSYTTGSRYYDVFCGTVRVGSVCLETKRKTDDSNLKVVG